MSTVFFYVSGHGFGHASRDIEVINALRLLRPGTRVVVRTAAARWLFDLTVRDAAGEPAVEYHPCETDTGIVQIDSLNLDEAGTVRRAREFLRDFDRRVTEEAALIAQEGAALVVADIPPLGVAAGHAAGVRTVALGNFTWDWIYSAYPGTGDLVDRIGAAYATAGDAFRLPLHGGFATLPHAVDVPFIARRSTRDPADTRRTLGLPADERLVLVSFGGYGIDRLDLDALSTLDGYLALVSGSVPLGKVPDSPPERRGSVMRFDEARMYAAGVRYEDLVRAVDVVVTKPGYGIIAECVANDTALLYTSRGHFIEYDVLVREMPHVLRTAYIDHADLLSGRWTPHLEALLAQPAPREPPRVDGAEVIAVRLAEAIG